MSVDYSTYIGPFAEVTTEVIEVNEDRCRYPHETQTCPAKNQVSGFCSKCGIDLSMRVRKAKRDKVQFDRYEAFGDNLAVNTGCGIPPSIVQSDGKSYRKYAYVPNTVSVGMHIGENEEGVWILKDDVLRDAEIALFKRSYALELQSLKDAYGDVTVAWGMVRWAS